MTILAIDPGFVMSGVVVYNPSASVVDALHLENAKVLDLLRGRWDTAVAIEGMTNQDARAGGEVIETCVWIGRFVQACEERGLPWHIVPRSKVKSHFKARNDADIRAAILDKYGPQFDKRVVERTGKKGQPLKPKTVRVPLLTSQLSNHTWAAFALASYVVTEGDRGSR